MDQQLKVMIVDDESTVLEITGAILEDHGYRVSKRGSALGTSLAILREKPDVVLLDVNMPGLSGDRIAELLAPRKDRTGPLVILHSSGDELELTTLAQSCGAAGAIAKTADAAEFMRRFNRITGTSRSIAPSR